MPEGWASVEWLQIQCLDECKGAVERESANGRGFVGYPTVAVLVQVGS